MHQLHQPLPETPAPSTSPLPSEEKQSSIPKIQNILHLCKQYILSTEDDEDELYILIPKVLTPFHDILKNLREMYHTELLPRHPNKNFETIITDLSCSSNEAHSRFFKLAVDLQTEKGKFEAIIQEICNVFLKYKNFICESWVTTSNMKKFLRILARSNINLLNDFQLFNKELLKLLKVMAIKDTFEKALLFRGDYEDFNNADGESKSETDSDTIAALDTETDASGNFQTEDEDTEEEEEDEYKYGNEDTLSSGSPQKLIDFLYFYSEIIDVIRKHLRTIDLLGNQYEHFLTESEQLTMSEGEIKLIAKFFEENSTFFRAPFYRSNVFYDFIAKDSSKELRQINASFKDKLGEKLKTEYKQIMSSPKPFFNEDNPTEFQIFLQKNHEIAIFLLRKLHRLEFFSKRYKFFLKNLPDKKRSAESISSLEPYISPRSPAETSEEEEKESLHRIMRRLATFEEFISSPTENCSLLPIEVMSLSLQLKNIRNLYQQSTKKETFIETITCICNNSDENSNQFKKQAEELLDLIENLRSLIIAVCESSIDYSVFIWRNSDDLKIFFTFLTIAESVKEAYEKFLANFTSLAEKENAKKDCQKFTDKKQEFKEFLYRYPSIAIFIFDNLSALKSWSDAYRDWKNNFIYQQKFLISNFFYDDSCLVFFLNLCRFYPEATSEKTENKIGKASPPYVQVFQNFTETHTDAFNHLQSSILHQSSLKKIREELYKFLAANPAVVDFWFQQFTKFFTSAASLIAREKHLLFQEAKRHKNNSHQLTLPIPSPPAL